jgi:uroporphyrinogen decarboxylase
MRTTADCGADVIGVDWTIDLAKARDKIGGKVAIQGNLDPTVLYAEPSFIRREVKKVLQSFGEGNGHIFNLGHGILPDIKPAHAKALVDFVKEESKKFHRKDAETQRI